LEKETIGLTWCSLAMRHENVTVRAAGPDWKALGYIISIVSVFLLGAVAWPMTGEPRWQAPVLIAGMATSIIGMGCRYKAHLDQRRELKQTKAEARRS
jgi:hypothetical protein